LNSIHSKVPHKMHASVCDPNDASAVARFRRTLDSLGARLDDKGWAIGVDVYHLKIGNEDLTVFSDTWSLDMEGSDDLVQRILKEYERAVG